MPYRTTLQAGSSLIEVLVTLLVFSVGLLGLAAMQLNALQGSADSGQRSQATWIAQDMAERFRANPEGTAATYATAPDCTQLPGAMCADYYNPGTATKVNAAACTAAQMAAFDRWESQCSYADLAAFNTIDGRFTSRDFLRAPAIGTTLTVVANSTSQLSLSANWSGKADSAKGAANTDATTTAITVQR